MACGCGGGGASAAGAADSVGSGVLLSGTVSGAAYDASGGAQTAGIVQGPDGAEFTPPVRWSFFGGAVLFGLLALIAFGALRKRES
jgi:hypothetical protein